MKELKDRIKYVKFYYPEMSGYLCIKSFEHHTDRCVKGNVYFFRSDEDEINPVNEEYFSGPVCKVPAQVIKAERFEE